MKLITFFFSCAMLLLSCYSSKTPRDRERSYTKPYHRGEEELRIKLFLHHEPNNISALYYHLDNSQLLYKKADTSAHFSARVRFQYKFLPYPEAKQVLDSGTVYVEDKSLGEAPKRMLTGKIPLRAVDGQLSYLELFVEDAGNKKNHTHYIECDRRNVYSQQNYLFKDENGSVIFTNKIELGKRVYISNERMQSAGAKIEFYRNDYALPPPPFSDRFPELLPSIPDSTWLAQGFPGKEFAFTTRARGIYFIRTDSSGKEGCTLLGVESNFPKVQSHAQMIASSRYIMNKEEYQKLSTATDKQAAIEAFWLSLAGNNDRAKELIKRYYNRVQDANTFFTSHIEGWRTDMGMIYIIFGTPGKTYKTSGMETWEYYIQTGAPPLTFRFEKIRNPFSENCYKLQRTINYKDPWTLAVSYWREGRVYLED